MINIEGLDKPELLMALYDHAWQMAKADHGFGLYLTGAITPAWFAENMKKGITFFNVVYGKPLYVDISGNEMDERIYDEKNEPGLAARVISGLRAKQIKEELENED